MESKYTKGPWEFAENGYVYCDDSLGSAVAKYNLEFRIGIGNKESQANGKLIAAAPELLEALQQLLHWYKDATTVVPRNYDVVDRVEAAILKATSI